MEHEPVLFDLKHRGNLWLQMALLLNVYLSAVWAVLYGFNILYNLSGLWDFHGIFVLIAYVVAVFAECLRLFFGYSGNLRAKLGDLSIFLIATPLIQLPIMVFLFISAKSQRTFIQTNIGLIFGLMLLECISSVFAWRDLSQHQAALYKMRKSASAHDANLK